MMKMSLDHDISKMEEVIDALRTGLGKNAVMRALNRTIDQSQTQASKSMREKYSFKAATVKATMIKYKAYPDRLQATLRSKGRRTQLIDMQARQTSKGVRVRVGKVRKLIKGAFIATMKSGHVGVFIREDGTQQGKKGAIKNRKIKELYTIGIPEAFASQTIQQALADNAENVFLPRLKHEIEWLMKTKS